MKDNIKSDPRYRQPSIRNRENKERLRDSIKLYLLSKTYVHKDFMEKRLINLDILFLELPEEYFINCSFAGTNFTEGLILMFQKEGEAFMYIIVEHCDLELSEGESGRKGLMFDPKDVKELKKEVELMFLKNNITYGKPRRRKSP